MKRLYIFLVPLIFCLSQIILSQSRVELRSFYSNSLGQIKNYYIYLPDGYDQSIERYPVVYFLRNHEIEWFMNTLDGRVGSSLKEVVDQLIFSGLIGKMIIVGPNTGSNNGNYSCCTINLLRPDLAPAQGIGTGKFEDYFRNDLISHIDTTFRTISDQSHRGMDGFSLGGFASTSFSFRNPEVFSSIGSYDGTIMWKNLNDPMIPGAGPDDPVWLNETDYPFNYAFDLPRNLSYMLQHSASDILESADSTQLNLIRKIRFHLSESYCEGVGNHLRNLQLVETMRNKDIRNSWGNPLISLDAAHDYGFADEHATASLIKHWQTFKGSKVSAPSLINFSITENKGKNYEAVVFNYGPGPLIVNSISTGTSVFELENLPSFPVIISPEDDSLSFSISFKPQLDIYYTDTVYISSDDPNEPITRIILRGKGGCYKAQPGIIYAASGSKFYLINLDSLKAEFIGNYGRGWSSISSMSVDPLSEEMIGISNRFAPWFEIVKINTKGGDVFKKIDLQFDEFIKGTAFGSDGQLYLATANGKIFQSNPNYPYWPIPLLQISSTGLTISAFTFNPMTKEFWASVNKSFNQRDLIYKININTGDTTYIGRTGLNYPILSMSFNHQGILYGLIGAANNSLIRIDTTTGIGTLLASLGNLNLSAIAISPGSPTDLEQDNKVINLSSFYLSQNFPNPFNGSTKIKYSIPYSSKIVIKVFDMLGSEIKTLAKEEKSAGIYELMWYSDNLPSGVYFYRIQAENFVDTKKMLILK